MQPWRFFFWMVAIEFFPLLFLGYRNVSPGAQGRHGRRPTKIKKKQQQLTHKVGPYSLSENSVKTQYNSTQSRKSLHKPVKPSRGMTLMQSLVSRLAWNSR